MWLFAHPDNVPSHFGINFFMNSKQQKVTLYNVQSEYSINQLLLSPFKHDCHDYSSPTSKFKSREYCYLDVMSKLELKYCKVNKYWKVKQEYEKNVTQCIKPDFTLLNKFCKINCLDISIVYTFVKNDVKIYFPENYFPLTIIYNDNNKRRLYLEYSPKFTRMELLSTLGGLLGMWLGLSIDNVIVILFEITFKLFLKLQIKFINFYRTKIRPIFKFIIVLLLIFNLKQLCNEFLSGHTITKFTIINEIDWPDFNIHKYFNSYINKECEHKFNYLVKNYSNINEIMYKNYPELSNSYEPAFQTVFLREIILEYGYEYFRKNIFPEIDKITCTIIDLNENFIDCKNIFKIVLQINQVGFYLKFKFQKASLYQNINVNQIRKIRVIQNVQDCFSKKILIRGNNKNKYLFNFNQGTDISMKFQKVILLNSVTSLNNVKCISMIENKSYNLDDCWMIFTKDFLINILKFDCMPRDMVDFYVDDLKILKNKFCSSNQTLSPYLTKYFHELRHKFCPLTCKTEFVTVDFGRKAHLDKIKINMIPKSNFKPIFTHHLSMDYNNLIYDLGGTIGMWIGWSALTIPIYIYEIFNKSNYQKIRNFIIIIITILFIKLQLFWTKLIFSLKYLINLFLSQIIIIKNILFRRRIFQNKVIPIIQYD